MTKSVRCALAALLLLSATSIAPAHPPSSELVKLFPLDLGEFHQLPSMRPLVTLAKEGILQPEYFLANSDPNQTSPFLGGESEYRTANGTKLLVEILKTQSDSNAYSILTLDRMKARAGAQPLNVKPGDVGTASIVTDRGVAFFKGTIFARVTNESANDSKPAIALARLLAATFDKGEDDIPVLVKHLPDWQTKQPATVYAVNTGPLRDVAPNQVVINEVHFDGGTEAVVANYDKSQLVIVEFTTPQFAGDNDRRIVAKIQELKNQRQPAPAAYRRVGNYSVFVFDAPDEKSANQLIDQVKYEQVVQWLGDNPHWYERAERYLMRTTGGMVIAVVEGSIVALLICLGIGFVIGTVLFRRRRAQAAAAYTDAGGAVRLNLDELTANRDPRRLLESGKERQPD